MFKNIGKGISYYKGSFGLIHQLKLWKYFFVPIAICIVVAISVILSAYAFKDNLADYLVQSWTWSWGKETMQSILETLSFILIIVAGFLSYKRIVMALSAPFMSPISEKIEEHLTGENKPSEAGFWQLLIRGLKINMRNLMLELLWTFLLFIVGFLPLIGLLTIPVLFLMQAYFSGFGNMDYTLERHLDYNRSIAFVKKNRGLAIGNGIIFALLLLIPVVGFIIVLPLSVTAATKQTVEALQEQKK